MKKVILAMTISLIDLILIISGLTCLIVSFFVGNEISWIFNIIGAYGIGSAIGTSLTAFAVGFLVSWFGNK